MINSKRFFGQKLLAYRYLSFRSLIRNKIQAKENVKIIKVAFLFGITMPLLPECLMPYIMRLAIPYYRGVVKRYHDSLQKSYPGFDPRLPCQEKTTALVLWFFLYANAPAASGPVHECV